MEEASGSESRSERGPGSAKTKKVSEKENEPWACIRRRNSSNIQKRINSKDLNGEFDPGSGRTLAACLTHASRTENILRNFRME